jgi:uncharacterized protein YndB with AHSA1/START domain
MTTTISHGSPGSGAAVPPLRREVLVGADRDLAFTVFTDQIGAWWPLGVHSVHGADATVAFVDPGVGARIVESQDGADDSVWGTVTRWSPPELVAFTWHPGMSPDAASQVTVTFEETDGKTLVTLEHTGWESFGDRAAEARENYEGGWTVVLGGYAAQFTAG